MIRFFRWFALGLCLLRVLEFGIPARVYGTGVVPSDRLPGTRAWVLSLVQLIIHDSANVRNAFPGNASLGCNPNQG